MILYHYIIILYKIILYKMVVISIEGNIGAGKSTLLNKLKEMEPNLNYVPEPVDKWLEITDSKGDNILKLFYSDTKRWAYTFQNFAFITRNNIMKDCIKNKTDSDIFITERSIYTDKNIFAKMLYDDNKMTELEFTIYNYWFEQSATKETNVDAFIYLTTDVDLSDQRIKIRNREGENIDKSYLNRLDEYHKKWLTNIDDKPVLYFNTEKDDINKIINFIKNIS